MKLKCLFPFTFLEFHPKGLVYCCCPSWTKYGPVGNIKKQTIKQIWNGEKIVNLRKKIYAGEYEKVCNTKYCPYILNPINLNHLEKKADKKLLKIINQVKQKKTHLETGPWEVSLAHNGGCNLRCKMCISNQAFNPPEPKLGKIIYEKTLPLLLPDLKYLKLSGNGDPFAQKETLNFMKRFDSKKFPDIQFKILTNGTLLNKKMLSFIKHLNIEIIEVSVDAASQKIYEKIRIGGNWKDLQENLQLISQLRKKRKINNFTINMTVMKSNHRQLEEFAKMGMKLGCDNILFTKIFGVQNLAENINFFPDSKVSKKLRKSLNKPIFKNKRIGIEAIKEYKTANLSFYQNAVSKFKLLLFYPYSLFFILYPHFSLPLVKLKRKGLKYKTFIA